MTRIEAAERKREAGETTALDGHETHEERKREGQLSLDHHQRANSFESRTATRMRMRVAQGPRIARGDRCSSRAREQVPLSLSPPPPPPSERRRKLKRSRAVAGDRRSARNRIDVRNAHPDPRGARGEGVCTTMGAGGDESRESIHGSGRLLHPASVRWSNRRNISV